MCCCPAPFPARVLCSCLGWGQLGAVVQEEQPGWQCWGPEPWQLSAGRGRSTGLQTAGEGCRVTLLHLELGEMGTHLLCLCDTGAGAALVWRWGCALRWAQGSEDAVNNPKVWGSIPVWAIPGSWTDPCGPLPAQDIL